MTPSFLAETLGPEARLAMEPFVAMLEAAGALRIANLNDWLSIHRPQDLKTLADGLRRAGLPE